MRAEQLVVQRLEAVAEQLGRFLRLGLALMQNRGVVELDEGVDEELPVAA